jgi:hypothetical protein
MGAILRLDRYDPADVLVHFGIINFQQNAFTCTLYSVLENSVPNTCTKLKKGQNGA